MPSAQIWRWAGCACTVRVYSDLVAPPAGGNVEGLIRNLGLAIRRGCPGGNGLHLPNGEPGSE